MKKNVIVKEIKIGKDEWTKALDQAFKKKNKDVQIDGFRKGNAPKDIYIKKFGIESLYMDALDSVTPSAYQKVLEETKSSPVCEPKLDIKSINEDEVVFEFTLINAPEVTLGEYKDLKIKKEKAKVSEKEIAEEITKLQNQYAEIEVKENDAVICEGDTAVIDFEGFIDKEKLEGGSGENYHLEIGSHTFIPGFEEGLVGKKVNDEVELNLTFPENYTKDLANKKVLFKVKINEIKTRVLPEINKDFFLDLGYEDIETVDDLKNKIKKFLLTRKENEIEDKYAEECLAKAASNMQVDLNEEIIDDEVHHMIHQFEEQLKMQGLNIENYYEFTGTDHEKLHEQMEPEAIKRIKYRYLLEKVGEVEKIEITDKEADDKALEMANNYGISKEELMNAYGMKMREALRIIKGDQK